MFICIDYNDHPDLSPNQIVLPADTLLDAERLILDLNLLVWI